MIAALPTGAASDDVLGIVSLALLVVVIPVHVWRQRRRRIRYTRLRSQIVEAERLMEQGRYTEAEQH